MGLAKTFTNIGWIVEAKLRPGQREAFLAVMEDHLHQSMAEPGVLTSQYYMSDNDDILVFERFNGADSAYLHFKTSKAILARWLDSATLTHTIDLGDLPDDLRKRHTFIDPVWMRPLGGFAREGQGCLQNGHTPAKFNNVGWLVEAKLKFRQRRAFEAVLQERIEQALTEEGTLNYQYYLSEFGDVLVYKRFKDVESAFLHLTNWYPHQNRWVASATPIRVIHLGELPANLRRRHADLNPVWFHPLGGFARC